MDESQKEKENVYLKKAEGMLNEMCMDYWLARTQETMERL